MGDTFTAIIVGECLPATHKGQPVAKLGSPRAFEDGFADANSLFRALGFEKRAGLTSIGAVWLKNMWDVPGAYVEAREEAIERWRSQLQGPSSAGLFRATKRNVRVLCSSGRVAEDIARAHGLPAIPPVARGSIQQTTIRGAVWKFAVWYRPEIRFRLQAEAAKEFLFGEWDPARS